MSFTESQPVDPSLEDENETPENLRRAAQEGRKAAQERDAARAEAEAARREAAMLRAGINVDSRLGQLFMGSYDGELEPDAIKAAWDELGVPSTEEPPAEQTTETGGEEEAGTAGHQARQQLATGETHPPEEPPQGDPIEEGMTAFRDKVAKGGTRRGASAEVSRRVIDAGARGDERVVWNGWTEDELREAKEATR